MDYVFESDSQDFALSVTGEITDALIRWEPRIEEVEVSAKMEGRRQDLGCHPHQLQGAQHQQLL